MVILIIWFINKLQAIIYNQLKTFYRIFQTIQSHSNADSYRTQKLELGRAPLFRRLATPLSDHRGFSYQCRFRGQYSRRPTSACPECARAAQGHRGLNKARARTRYSTRQASADSQAEEACYQIQCRVPCQGPQRRRQLWRRKSVQGAVRASQGAIGFLQ